MKNLSETEIINGYWHWNFNKPARICNRVEEYSGEKLLGINCTQLENLTASEQKKIVNDWCDFLSKPRDIETIWFTSKVTQELFDSVCSQLQLQGLYIKWSGVKTIQQITELKNLQYLYIGSSSKIVDITPLTSLSELIFLYLENLQRIHDYSLLAELKHLEGLCLTGNVFSPQILKIDSLKFLETLHNLKYFDLDTTKVLDNSYDAICHLNELRTFQINTILPKELRQQIKDTLKKLKYGFFMEYDWENKKKYSETAS